MRENRLLCRIVVQVEEKIPTDTQSDGLLLSITSDGEDPHPVLLAWLSRRDDAIGRAAVALVRAMTRDLEQQT